MKKLLIIAMLFIASISYSQSFNTFYYDGSLTFGWYSDNIDSTGSTTGEWLKVGWDLIDNQTIYLSHLLGAGTGGGTITNDSATIIIQGRTPYKTTTGTTAYLTTNMDTILVIGNTIATQVALSLTSFHPEVRLVVTATGHASTPNNNNRTLALTFYAKVNDVVNPRNRYFW